MPGYGLQGFVKGGVLRGGDESTAGASGIAAVDDGAGYQHRTRAQKRKGKEVSDFYRDLVSSSIDEITEDVLPASASAGQARGS